MYLQHFGLTDRPFRIVPSPRFFFVSETHDEGRARILYGIRENSGFVVVTGGVGLGKTTVLLSVLNELEPDNRIVFLMRDVHGMSTSDTAAALGLSVPAVKSRLHRARLFLREKLSDYFEHGSEEGEVKWRTAGGP